jgi:hypothetical protein
MMVQRLDKVSLERLPVFALSLPLRYDGAVCILRKNNDVVGKKGKEFYFNGLIGTIPKVVIAQQENKIKKEEHANTINYVCKLKGAYHLFPYSEYSESPYVDVT